MKKCPTCNLKYDDSKAFCPRCGNRLVADVTMNQTGTTNNTNPFFAQWGAALIAVVGLIICWYISGVLGMAIAITGGIYGYKSDNALNKIISTGIAVLTVILYIIYCL